MCSVLFHIVLSMPIIHILCVQGLKTELEKVSPALGRTAIYTRESRINELPRQVYRSVCLLTCCRGHRNILHIDSFLQVPDCAVRSFLLEKGIKPKGKDLTSMLAFYTLSLEQCFDDYSYWVLYGIFIIFFLILWYQVFYL